MVLFYVVLAIVISLIIGFLVNWAYEADYHSCPFIKWKNFITLYKKSDINNWDLHSNTVYYKGVGHFRFYPIGYYKYKIMKYRRDKKITNKNNISQYDKLIKAVQYDYEQRSK